MSSAPLTPAMVRRWPEPRLLIALVGVAAAGSVFIKLAGAVAEGSTRGIDAAILMALRAGGDRLDPLGPRWVEEMMRDLTALGSLAVLGIVTVAAAVFLVLLGRRRTAVFVFAATAGGTVVSSVLKELFERPRPDLVPHGAFVSSASFPSGHAMSSAVVYLTLGVLVARVVPGRWAKVYVIAVAGVLTGIVGVSRLYLGVHWPSDVLAGWAAGGAWALGCWVVAQLLGLRRAPSPPG